MPAKKNTSKKKSKVIREVKKEELPITVENKTPPIVDTIPPESTPSMVTVPVEEEPQTSVLSEPIIPEEPEASVISTTETSRSVFWIVPALAFLIGAIVGGGVIYTFSGLQNTAIKAPTASPIVIASAEPSPVLERSSLKLQVLNGTGIKGEASKIKLILEKVGYTDVQTGNAASQDFTLTEISIKDAKKDFISLLTKDLATDASISSEIKTLDEKSVFDAIVTLGKE